MAEPIDIYTDGACLGNPGPGGWGALMRGPVGEDGLMESEVSGGESDTTNNRMELMAAIVALETVPETSTVRLHTDSKYVKDGITQWITNWKRNGWRTANRKPVKNIDLWQRLDAVVARHDVSWHWIKGHSGHPENERADALAVAAAQTVQAAIR